MLALPICLLLSGCSSFKGDKAEFDNWRQEFLAAERREISAKVRSNEENRACEYELLYSRDSEGESIAVLDDELIAGVTARIEGEEAQLLFDGVVLETGSSLTGSPSPLSALPLFIDSLEEGFVKTTGREKKEGEELRYTQLEMPDGLRLSLWQNADSMEPVFAAIQSDEMVDITISFIKIL